MLTMTDDEIKRARALGMEVEAMAGGGASLAATVDGRWAWTAPTWLGLGFHSGSAATAAEALDKIESWRNPA